MRGLQTAAVRIEITSRFLDDPGQRAGFVLLGSFLLSFLFVRTSTRLIRSPRVPWWPGNVVTESGLHVHHLVWGILMMLVSGFLGFALDRQSPLTEILAAGFGVGAGLTLDEFALWLRLQDVYWKEEGRASFDAVVVAFTLGGLVLVGVAPFDLHNNDSSIAGFAAALVVVVLIAAVAVLKGKPLVGMIGIFMPLVALVGAVRLASPSSVWARRRYDPGGPKLARAQARWKRIEARRRHVRDAIAGAPEAPTVAADPIPAGHERTASDLDSGK